MRCKCGDDRAKRRTIYWPTGEHDNRIVCDECWILMHKKIECVRDTYHRIKREGVPIGHIRRILSEAYRPTTVAN